MSKALPRGIAPDLLVSQIRNTMPYLPEETASGTPLGQLPPAREVAAFEARGGEPLSQVDYFRLCLAAHFLTCATPVPTDVDNQIRQKLWPEALPAEMALAMAEWVLESRRWDFTQLSRRFVHGAAGSEWEKETLSGHLGEWFTVAAAAYGALGRYAEPEARAARERLLAEIGDEVRRHSEIFGSLWRAGDGVGSLKAAASVSHNFGDLDRVMDMWELPVTDPLRLEYGKLATSPYTPDRKLRYKGRLWVAGELYKSTIDGSSLALENHRHFALRKPRALRKSLELVVPTGPFFDAWGERVARALDGEELVEVIEALLHGWERLPRTIGYGRGLRGIHEAKGRPLPEPPARDRAQARAWRQAMETPVDRFERRWAEEALRLMDEIPSRA